MFDCSSDCLRHPLLADPANSQGALVKYLRSIEFSGGSTSGPSAMQTQIVLDLLQRELAWRVENERTVWLWRIFFAVATGQRLSALRELVIDAVAECASVNDIHMVASISEVVSEQLKVEPLVVALPNREEVAQLHRRLATLSELFA
jgi:hypothetical protein